MKGLGTGLTVRRKELVQGDALKLELHSLHPQSPSAADIPVLWECVQEIWGPHFHGQTSFLTSSWRMAFAKCIRENKFLSTINLCPYPNNFPSPMPAIQEKKKCQMQSFHQKLYKQSQPWWTLSYKINWPEKKKPDAKKPMLYDSFYEIQKQSKLICRALSQGSGYPWGQPVWLVVKSHQAIYAHGKMK